MHDLIYQLHVFSPPLPVRSPLVVTDSCVALSLTADVPLLHTAGHCCDCSPPGDHFCANAWGKSLTCDYLQRHIHM